MGGCLTVDGAGDCPCPQLQSCLVIALFIGSPTRLIFIIRAWFPLPLCLRDTGKFYPQEDPAWEKSSPLISTVPQWTNCQRPLFLALLWLLQVNSSEPGHCWHLGPHNSLSRDLGCVSCGASSTLALPFLDAIISPDPNCDNLQCFIPEVWRASLLICVLLIIFTNVIPFQNYWKYIL